MNDYTHYKNHQLNATERQEKARRQRQANEIQRTNRKRKQQII